MTNQDVKALILSTWDFDKNRKIEERFDTNIRLSILRRQKKANIFKIKENLTFALTKFLSKKQNFEKFDMIYIDAHHSAECVLFCANISFELLSLNGLMVFDDYLWQKRKHMQHIMDRPKLAIDAFVNINLHKLKVLNYKNNQIYLEKIKSSIFN